MKFIARRDFRRAGPALSAPPLIEGQPRQRAQIPIVGGCKGATDFDKETGLSKDHDDVIHRGAIIELGSFQNETQLRASNTPEATLARRLRVANCISDASNKEEVAGVEGAIAIDLKREEAAKKRDKTVAASDATEALLKLDTVQKKLDSILGNPKVAALLAKDGA